MFANRQQAGAFLSAKISDFLRAENIDCNQLVVLALPRGGVIVALEIALNIGCPLNVLAAKKIGAPQQRELAVGAVTSRGLVIVDETLTHYLSVEPAYLKKETEYLISKTRELEHRWRQAAGIEERLNVVGKVVIVVDDGVATGKTATAAGRCLKEEGADKVILAAPVIAANTLKSLLIEYDQVIALDIPVEFAAVGQFYSDFRQVEDVEVVQALTQAISHKLVKSI